VGDHRLIAYLESHVEQVLDLDPAALLAVAAGAVRVKAQIVALDEREAGRRALLNYGHTFGHAIESATGYRRFRHGEAVALGMVAAASLATGLGICSLRTAERQNQLLARAGLPLRAGGLSIPAILANMQYDKKIERKRRRFVLTSKVGSASLRPLLSRVRVERAIRSIT
jgi:3-dehydroquinate synthase